MRRDIAIRVGIYAKCALGAKPLWVIVRICCSTTKWPYTIFWRLICLPCSVRESIILHKGLIIPHPWIIGPVNIATIIKQADPSYFGDYRIDCILFFLGIYLTLRPANRFTTITSRRNISVYVFGVVVVRSRYDHVFFVSGWCELEFCLSGWWVVNEVLIDLLLATTYKLN